MYIGLNYINYAILTKRDVCNGPYHIYRRISRCKHLLNRITFLRIF